MIEISTLLVLVPIFGAILIWSLKKDKLSIFIAISSVVLVLVIAFIGHINLDPLVKGFQFQASYKWIPSWNVNISFGLDHLNSPFVLLTAFITLISILLSVKTVKKNVSSYMAMFLLFEATVLGFFLSTNFLVFFFFYEAMLIPAVLLIHRWGGKNSYSASMKFLIYTFGFSIFLFISIIAVYVYAGGFDFDKLYSLKLSYQAKYLLFLGFFLAFAVKIPVVPLHGWLRDAYYESPMPVTIFLSAVLGKMGIYGLLRVTPAFSDILTSAGPWILFLCILSFVYASFLALSERDIKAMFAYMSLSHVGIITAGAFTGNIYGFQGSILQSINHGILAAALFYIADLLNRHTASFDGEKFGALSKRTPAMVFFTFACILAMGGFPGLNYFNGELMLLSGIFANNTIMGFFAIFGVALGVVYLAWFFYRVFLRKPGGSMSEEVKDLKGIDFLIFIVFFFIFIYLGLNPKFIIGALEPLVSVAGGKG